MALRLKCDICSHPFKLSPETPAGKSLARMTADSGWHALGDGQTVEDLLYANLGEVGAISCPACGMAVPVSESDLSELAVDLLARS